MTAAEIFSHAALVIFQHLGVPVIYTPVMGTPVSIQALITGSLQLQPSGFRSETWAQQYTVEIMLSDLPAGSPVPGDTVTSGAVVYTLVAPLENNGLLVKWVAE